MRSSSLSPVVLPGWRWQAFLDKAVELLTPFEPQPYPVPEPFLWRSDKGGSASRPFEVTTATWACRTNKLRQVRAAFVEGGDAASVLNFVINPSCEFELPFFGADLVTLPNGHLLALDLQPALKNDAIHTQAVWEKLIPLHSQWSVHLPSGGPIPAEAEPFFSPGFLWTRIPLGAEGDQLIQAAVMPAFISYLNLYLSLVNEACPVDKSRSEKLLEGQLRYSKYRALKDPARGMLSRFHGAEWTETYIHKVLFDL
ncbi:phycoerythrobilin:ferredoxin oxidoreductase [uncultured Synechococcus sp.]|uniref:phycoerythrobilin:ferredoxin oxidoreductase n=1 Tax=uncultured Synechococcus sp. TaxID=154535 RepID=UPI00259A4FF0|nr:phycoerythrobilin:ferredoxin oxidoreductase [uncultured Synechococcus sp.]